MKFRADDLMLKQGLAESREKAKRLIMAGEVYVYQNNNLVKINKPGHFYPADRCLQLKQPDRFVSRGGYKLLTALEHFGLSIKGCTALDVGASTGGFTDCLLQYGASLVYAVDVGYGQLHWKLRQNERVINLERINMRYAPDDLLPALVDIIVVDCSFISVQKILFPSCKFLKENGSILVLVKPQFELKAGQTEKGVVRQSELHKQAVQNTLHFVDKNLPGLKYVGVVPSNIKGPKGNQEFVILWQNSNSSE